MPWEQLRGWLLAAGRLRLRGRLLVGPIQARFNAGSAHVPAASLSQSIPVVQSAIAADFERLALSKKALAATRLVRNGDGHVKPDDWVAILNDLIRCVPDMSPVLAASMSNAVAKLGLSKGSVGDGWQEVRSLKVGLFAALATKLCSDANLLGPQELGQEIARAVSGLANSQAVPATHPAFDALSEAALKRSDDFQGSSAVQLVNGLAKLRLGSGPEGLLSHFAYVLQSWLSAAPCVL
eukprot:s2498_g1.t1